jgi:hypothetical protein
MNLHIHVNFRIMLIDYWIPVSDLRIGLLGSTPEGVGIWKGQFIILLVLDG